MLEAVADLLRDRADGAIVEHAHMELAPPTIAEAFDRCVEQGAKTVAVALFFLSPGRHSIKDIPALVNEAAARQPGVKCVITDPLGVATPIVEVMLDRVKEAIDE